MEIRSQNRHLTFALCAAGLVTLGMSSLLVYLKVREGTATTSLFVVMSFFIVMGLLLLAWGGTSLVRVLRFGEGVLHLARGVPSLGGELDCTLRIPRRFTPTGPMRLITRCLHNKVTYSRSGTSGARTRTTDVTILWQDEQTQNVSLGAITAGVPIRIGIPRDKEPTYGSVESGGILWQLEVLIPTHGVDFHATFDFPVLPS